MEEGGAVERDEVIESWVDTYGDRLLRLAYLYVHNRVTAEDCVQEAFIKAYRKMGQLKDENNPLPWLMRIVVNQCRDHGRQRREILTAELIDPLMPGPEEEVMNEDVILHIHRAVTSLPEKYRLPVVLHYFEDMTLEDIAKVLGENSGTIRTRIRRAREKLRKIVEKEGGRDEFGRTAAGGEIRPSIHIHRR